MRSMASVRAAIARGVNEREHPPQPGVVRRVHVQHHPADPLEVLGVADLRRAQPGGEGGGVAQHPFDLGVPQHQPEARALREPVQRQFLDQVSGPASRSCRSVANGGPDS